MKYIVQLINERYFVVAAFNNEEILLIGFRQERDARVLASNLQEVYDKEKKGK